MSELDGLLKSVEITSERNRIEQEGALLLHDQEQFRKEVKELADLPLSNASRIDLNVGGITCLLFDVGNVTVVDEHPRIMFDRFLTKYPKEEHDRIRQIHSRNRDLWQRIKVDPTFTEDEYWKIIVQREQLKETIEELKIAVRECFLIHSSTVEFQKKLVEKNFTLAICSNHITPWMDHIFEKFELNKIFSRPELVVVSQAVKCCKPNMEIFQIAYERLEMVMGNNFDKQKVLFVDDKVANLNAARKFGFRVIQFCANRETDLEGKIKLVYGDF
eukprot:TRINITY_DN5561_c0_g4_i1.p1 TRINITY_DN5561_c0_g4~~TRINITY_DN5561_c0_g4_i1.p1  ORF type:complete len:300 (+),score=61.63 TRINITY_DN5561_c0_g4_i1:80-901(+)